MRCARGAMSVEYVRALRQGHGDGIGQAARDARAEVPRNTQAWHMSSSSAPQVARAQRGYGPRDLFCSGAGDRHTGGPLSPELPPGRGSLPHSSPWARIGLVGGGGSGPTVRSAHQAVPPPPPPMSIPPQGTTVPPQPGGNRHQVTVPPLGGGGGGNRTPLPTSQF